MRAALGAVLATLADWLFALAELVDDAAERLDELAGELGRSP